MLVSTLNPLETMEWFNREDTQHEIICCMITASPAHRNILRALAVNSIDADAALGKKVGFLLFGNTKPENFQPLDYANTLIPGELIVRKVAPLNEIPEWVLTRDRQRMIIARNLADSTANLADEWMTTLEVKRSDLPVLCILIRGVEPTVVSLNEDIDEKSVLGILGSLADIAQRNTFKFVKLSIDAQHRVDIANQLLSQRESALEALGRQLEAISNHYKLPTTERDRLARLLAFGPHTVEALFRALSQCGATERDDFDASTRGARNCMRRLEEIALAYEENRPAPNNFSSLADTAAELIQRQSETERLVKKLQSSGIRVKQIKPSTLGLTYDKIVDRADKTASLLEKLGKVASFLG